MTAHHHTLSHHEARTLADETDTADLMHQARQVRDRDSRGLISYSRKVFIPVTRLCRNLCHYCTFSRSRKTRKAYLELHEVLASARAAQKLGCREVLFTLGEKPELRYQFARDALDSLGFDSTIAYVAYLAEKVLNETGLLPHINAGCLARDEMVKLRRVSASMGLMLESASRRLCERGMPHYGSPDKLPENRLATIDLAGQLKVPFTSGILIGIGETRIERIESLLALRELHDRRQHIQEIIIQSFKAKPGTPMAERKEPDLNELLWTIAVARLIFGPEMNIQTPPNLNPGVLKQLLNAGINDWGGISPITPDYVNPEAPWPLIERLSKKTESTGKYLQERLTLYPGYCLQPKTWLDQGLHASLIRHIDTEGFARTDEWTPGLNTAIPEAAFPGTGKADKKSCAAHDIRAIIAQAEKGVCLSKAQVVRLFQARGAEFHHIYKTADQLRLERCGQTVGYVVNRNINYTNICGFKCQFCAFSKGTSRNNLRDSPYNLGMPEIANRAKEAWERGAREVCLQGGIHPQYTGQTYLEIVRTIRTATPLMHIHAFSPLEVWQGAKTLNLPLTDYLRRLKREGLNSLPGTAAEILDDGVRQLICHDKIRTKQWLEVIEIAHAEGIPTTATIMFGHLDNLAHWAEHLLTLRAVQYRTGGFTELIPLPFVPMESPLYRKGFARRGPTFREAILMYAVARITLHGLIDNIQASWVKLGDQGTVAGLNAGANDIGGTLMEESITRSAGAAHGQLKSPAELEKLILSAHRTPRQRDTLYRDAIDQRPLLLSH